MSEEVTNWSTLRERVAGKWQIPLLVLSLALLGVAFLRLRPTPSNLPTDRALTYLDQLIGAGLFDRAIDLAQEALDSSRDQSPVAVSAFHLRFARALHGQGLVTSGRSQERGKRIVEHYGQAVSDLKSLGPDDLERFGRAMEWQRRTGDAVTFYRRAIDQDVRDRFDLWKHTVELMQFRLDTSAEALDQELTLMLERLPEHRHDLLVWALERELEVLEELGGLSNGATLLARFRDRLKSSEFFDRFRCLEALLLFKNGQRGEAERYLRAIRGEMDTLSESNAMSGWLLGLSILQDEENLRPSEALSFFEDVLSRHDRGIYAVACRFEKGRALALEGHHAEALEAFRAAFGAYQSQEGRALSDQASNVHGVVDRDLWRATLSLLADDRGREGDLESALDYVRLVVDWADESDRIARKAIYLEQLADILAALGERGLDEEAWVSGRVAKEVLQTAVNRLIEAGEAYLALAQLHVFEDQVAAEATWRAAEAFAAAKEYERAVNLFETFVREQLDTSLIPRALLRIGQLNERQGKWSEAIEAYRDCYRRYPRTLDAVRTLVPLARCYLASGVDNAELAEKTLQVVLKDSEVFTPQAPEFADALFLLGETYDRQNEYEKAITVLEEAIDRYPEDKRVPRARFLLANGYRKSALALKAEATEVRLPVQIERLRQEMEKRLVEARNIYRSLIDSLQARYPPDYTRLEQLQLHQSLLYEGDCYFEGWQYRTALTLYESAVGVLRDTPSVLAAYVQIINCHVFLEQPDEARTALSRALILVDAMPDEAFDSLISPLSREDWKRHFEWLKESELF